MDLDFIVAKIVTIVCDNICILSIIPSNFLGEPLGLCTGLLSVDTKSASSPFSTRLMRDIANSWVIIPVDLVFPPLSSLDISSVGTLVVVSKS